MRYTAVDTNGRSIVSVIADSALKAAAFINRQLEREGREAEREAWEACDKLVKVDGAAPTPIHELVDLRELWS